MLSGKIVETEAYRGKDDPASHAYRGLTKRNAVMFGDSGRAYIYFAYGAHFCLNITTEMEGRAGAVLIRALEPIHGIEFMKKNRGIDELTELTNGPGKLTKAMRIGLDLNGEDLITSQRLYILEGKTRNFEVKSSARIGIKDGLEHRWRYFINCNPFVSKGKPSTKSLQFKQS
jgi:DNA-3-methyladenine glycosylase